MAQSKPGYEARVYRLIYYSQIMLPFGDPREIGMPDLIARSRLRNATLGITGVLYSDDVYFSQVLEGPKQSVDAVFASIRRDRRHMDITVVQEGPQSSRIFEGWDMQLVCDARARKAIGEGSYDLNARAVHADIFAALMAHVISRVPATWSAPPSAASASDPGTVDFSSFRQERRGH